MKLIKLGLPTLCLIVGSCLTLWAQTKAPPSRDHTIAETLTRKTVAASNQAGDSSRVFGRAPEDFGAVCDGVADDYPSLQRWLQALASDQLKSSGGVHGHLTNSCYSSKSLSAANIGLYLDGSGPGSAQLVFAPSIDGLVIDNSKWSKAIPVEVHNVAFLTNSVGEGVGLTVKGNPAYQNLIRTEVIENVRFSGANPSLGWFRGHDGEFILNGLIDRVYVAGVSNFSGHHSQCGIYLSGGSNIVNITNSNIDWVETGVCVNTDDDHSSNEGVRLIDSTVRASHYGFVARGGGDYHVVQGGHFDVVKGAVDIGSTDAAGGDFSRVSGLFVLRSSADSWSGHGFVGVGIDANYPIIAENTMWLDGYKNGDVIRQANSTGVLVGDAKNSNKPVRGSIYGNELVGLTTGIKLLPSTQYTSVFGNQGDAYGNKSGVNVVNDGDVTNTVRENPYVGR